MTADTQAASSNGSDGGAGGGTTPAPPDRPSIKATLQTLETSWHGYLADVASQIFEVRTALAEGDYDGADHVSERLMAELYRQLEALDRVREPDSVRPLF